MKTTLSFLAGLVLIIVMSQVSFNIPYGEGIPITGQSLGVLIIGYFLPLRISVLVLISYLMIGIFGFPVFAEGGSGIEKLMGKSGGYLYSFPMAAGIVSYLEYGKKSSYFIVTKSFTLGTALILGIGTAHLGFLIGLTNAIKLGLFPFIFGGLIKIFIAVFIVYMMRKWQSKLV